VVIALFVFVTIGIPPLYGLIVGVEFLPNHKTKHAFDDVLKFRALIFKACSRPCPEKGKQNIERPTLNVQRQTARA